VDGKPLVSPEDKTVAVEIGVDRPGPVGTRHETGLDALFTPALQNKRILITFNVKEMVEYGQLVY
jgi:hypothetical protein